MTFQPPDSTLHDIHLHLQAVDLVRLVGDVLQLSREDIKVRHASSGTVGGWGRSRTQLGSNGFHMRVEVLHARLQPLGDNVQSLNVPSLGLDHPSSVICLPVHALGPGLGLLHSVAIVDWRQVRGSGFSVCRVARS